ncbi:protein SRC2-like protein [Forsythia ovata]|uniref:Protein SRC2-like protein n=1 Tax=Forsythia ovata TaxID=205694 RepID=A0ABD1WK16_9LAMI
MRKLWVEICLISGRGLQRTSSLWKLQWFAVGWIDPNNQYCTNIDASGNNNPVWKTKFSITVDTSEPNFQDLALQVEVYSREPIFLRQSLLGTATIVLKEFMDKYISNSEVSKPVEEVGSFQLRKKNSNKPQGFVDISIRISEERKDPGSSSLGGQEEYNLMDHSGSINLVSQYIPQGIYQPRLPQTQPQEQASHPLANSQYGHPMPIPTNYSQLPNYPPVGRPARGGPGFGMGVGAGALAAGAMIFGDDIMSGFDFLGGLQDASLTISADPPL